MPANADALWVFLLAIVPGYIASSVWSRSRTLRASRGQLQSVLESLAWSAVIQVVAAPLTITWLLPIRDDLEGNSWRVALWAGVVVLGLPLLLGLGGAFLFHVARSKNWAIVGRWREWPSAWDQFCNQSDFDGSYVLVEFHDGRMIGGYYGAGGFTITSPDAHGLFLDPEWIVNEHGDFTKEYGGSAGILIPNLDQVRVVRRLGAQREEVSDEHQGQAAGPPASAAETPEGGRLRKSGVDYRT